MRRPKALGVVFAYEGPQPTSEASDKKLTSGTGREKDTPSRSWTTRVHHKKLSTEREPGDLKLVVQEIPMVLEAQDTKPEGRWRRWG